MFGQRFAHWLLFGFRLRARWFTVMPFGRCFCFDKCQLKLIDDLVQRFGLRAEPLPPQIGELQLEFFNKKITRQKFC